MLSLLVLTLTALRRPCRQVLDNCMLICTSFLQTAFLLICLVLKFSELTDSLYLYMSTASQEEYGFSSSSSMSGLTVALVLGGAISLFLLILVEVEQERRRCIPLLPEASGEKESERVDSSKRSSA